MHKFLQISQSPYPLPTYSIVASYEDQFGHFRGEQYLLTIATEAVTTSQIEISISRESASKSPIAIDQDFILKLATEQAKVDFNLARYEYLSKRGEVTYEPVTIKELTELDVALLTFNQGIKDALINVRRHTYCEDLEEFLKKVNKLPDFHFKKSAF